MLSVFKPYSEKLFGFSGSSQRPLQDGGGVAVGGGVRIMQMVYHPLLFITCIQFMHDISFEE